MNAPRQPANGVSEPDVDPGEPIPELAGLDEVPSPRLIEHVLDGVNRRQTSNQLLEIMWWGWTSLAAEMLQSIFKGLGVREDSDRRN